MAKITDKKIVHAGLALTGLDKTGFGKATKILLSDTKSGASNRAQDLNSFDEQNTEDAAGSRW